MFFVLYDLPEGCSGVVAQRGDRAVIFVDRKLSPVDRLCVLAHELAHLDRGGSGWEPGLPVLLEAMVGREEARVDRIAADRLVPSVELAEWVARRVEVEPITAELVAEEFEVSVEVASLALSRLAA